LLETTATEMTRCGLELQFGGRWEVAHGEVCHVFAHPPKDSHHLLNNLVGETLRGRCKRRRCKYCSNKTQHHCACAHCVEGRLCIIIFTKYSPAQNHECIVKRNGGILPLNKLSLAVAQQWVARKTIKET
jgi:hypothetical protein